MRDRLEADMAFHNAIFRASGNRICQLLFKGIHRTVLTSMNQLSERVSVEQPLKFHRKIYAAIRARDAEAARCAMRDHILDARSLLTKKT
jgi:GntR family transcriptional regulator, transcriptional repressor for pyruvate dehydrogenase complex